MKAHENKDKREEVNSVMHVDEMATESLPPHMFKNWKEILFELAKNRKLSTKSNEKTHP